MAQKILYIKNMVCDRCISSVSKILDEYNIGYSGIELGRVMVEMEELDKKTLQKLEKQLLTEGFELIKEKNLELIEQIKALIINKIHYSSGEFNQNFSEYIEKKLEIDYSRLSRLFSESEGTTIEKFIILQKIERVKELIEYAQLNFSEIAYKVGYSSSAHLAKQFKKQTGYTLTQYKNLPEKQRKKLDKI